MNEFARLFQCYGTVEGMNMLEWINKSQVPPNKKVTYPRYTVATRPEKEKPFRTRIIAGGDRLEYFGDVSTDYQDLIRHPNKDIKDRWDNSGVNEFARLFQGFGDIEGMNVLKWIDKSEVPNDKKVTYPRYTVAWWPEKDEPFRTRITAGGDRLEYAGEVSTDSASMETIKCHWNSVLSNPYAKILHQ